VAASPTPAPTFRQPQSDAFGRLVEQVAGDFDPRESELNELWQGIFDRTQVDGQQAYHPPAGVAPYQTSEVPPIACAAGVPARAWPRGAFYCPADEWIVYDELWLREFQGLQGEFAPAAVLAHEWGHHVQQLFGQAELDIQDELQADCFAGMFLAYRELPPGASVFQPRIDEFSAALATFFSLANSRYSESSWFQADEHGSQFQRMLAFGTGSLPLDRGLAWCYGYREFIHGDFAQIGPYRLVNLPGRVERWDGDVYVIEPEQRLSDASSRITLEWLPRLPIVTEGGTFDQLAALAGQRLRDPVLVPPGVDLSGSLPGLAGWMALYDSQPGAESPVSGFFAVIASAPGKGGLVIDVSRPEHAPANSAPGATLSPDTLEVLAEEIVAVYQTTTRLCGPDQSDQLDEPNWSMACEADQ
jgi:hypothetical protein